VIVLRERQAGAVFGRGYTLPEVIAVVVIITVLISISVPAFTSLQRSAGASRADTLVRLGASAAQDAALNAGAGRDGAVVFLFDPGGRIRIVAGTQAGVLRPEEDRVPRAVFVADPSIETIELPTGMLVRGLAPANSMRTPTGADSTDDDAYGWYSRDRYDVDRTNWVLPESGFLDTGSLPADEGHKRQSFMLRFEGGTGRASVDTGHQALFFDPLAETEFRTANPWDREGFRPDLRVNHRSLVVRALNDPALSDADRELLVGDESPDTVLTRQVPLIGLYSVRDLASAVGDLAPPGFPGVDQRSGSLYRGTDLDGGAFDPALADAVNRRIGSVASLFTVERYSGRLARVPGEGVEP